MAIVRRESVFPVDQFVGGIEHARSAIVRVYTEGPSGSHGLCTGWFITPDLVITVGFAFEQARKSIADPVFKIDAYDSTGALLPHTILGAPELLGQGLYPHAGDAPMLALLRVPPGVGLVALDLCFDDRVVDDWVCVVQFPEGKPVAGVSFGRIASFAGALVSYDANTMPGTSGAPVLEKNFSVVAVHVAHDLERRVNQGVTRSAMITALRSSSAWPEIARHHRLADDVAAQVKMAPSGSAPTEDAKPDDVLIRAAITSSLDPTALPDDERALLREQVADANAARWVMRPSTRRGIIAAVGSLSALRSVRPAHDGHNAVDRVIDHILSGPPYDLTALDEESLANWLQAAKWFEGVAPDLPSPAQVAQRLERRRVQSRLDRIAGAGFRGRTNELKTLHDWFVDPKGPMVLTGVGGIGKSALVARFVSDLPDETLVLWLDFDRADLAPDDAVSVLSALADQASVQLDSFQKPVIDKNTWEAAAKAMGKQLKQVMGAAPMPILVLDSFEAAQYAERYQELWPVLEHIAKAVPALRLIVTGRAPVPALALRGRPAVSVHLKGLEVDDARDWLRDKGITSAAVLDKVIEMADGIPLILQLALRLVQKGGRIEDVPNDLPNTIVAGYLHDRILDRVNPTLRSVTTAALVLRRLTEAMVQPILGDLDGVTLPPGDVADWFPDLGREMAIVEGVDVLRVRPEVRTATLELLERDQLQFVKTIDQRAAEWYAGQDLNDPEISAELVYHRLRLGDVHGAEEAWRDGTGPFLTYSEDEIRDPAARQWLRDRLGSGIDGARPVHAWEQDAAERIRSVRGRGLGRTVSKILGERKDRSDASPLVFHEAFELRASGRSKQALRTLREAGDASGPVGRDRIVLQALLTSELGDRRAADRLLAMVDSQVHWNDRRSGALEALAVQAARVRLATDLDAEVGLLQRLKRDEDWHHVRESLSSVDVVMPRLKLRLRTGRPSFERNTDAVDLASDAARSSLLARIEDERVQTLPEEPAAVRGKRHQLMGQWQAAQDWHDPQLKPADFGLDAKLAGAAQLAEFGWRKWWFASSHRFLPGAYSLCLGRSENVTPLMRGIIGTLALFALRYNNLLFGDARWSLGAALRQSPVAHETLHLTRDAWERVHKLLTVGVESDHPWTHYCRATDQGEVVVLLGELVGVVRAGRYPMDLGPFLLSLVSPDPLPQLAADLAGLSDRAVVTAAMLE